ncbi:MAG: heme o synthase [Polyangiaceae bacterium]
MRDAVALTKPRITSMVVFTTAAGFWLGARYLLGSLSGHAILHAPSVLVCLLVGTWLVVSGANAVNMYLERDTDAKMTRTRTRPLPDGRMRPHFALYFGLSLASLAVPILSFGVNPITSYLAIIAFVSYVALYTPLKRRSTLALVVGAFPGAIPPLLGWSAVRGTLDAPGVLLFALMFFWQIPHFLAIATFRRAEYKAAGLKVLTVVRGDRVTRHHVVRWLAALLLSSFLLFPTALGGTVYRVTAIVLGAAFFGVGLAGLRQGAGVKWARLLFLVSMLYLVGIFAALLAGS